MSTGDTQDEKDRENKRECEPEADSAPTSGHEPIGPILESFLARFRNGERPSLTEYVGRYPALANEIRELLPALVEIEQLGSVGSAVAQAGAPSATDGYDPAAGLTAPLGDRAGPWPQRLGDYRILGCIGEGGMGVVYEAVRESLHSHVALKVMHPRFRSSAGYLRRFHNEARSAAQLHHTNIVSVFDYGEHDGVCYYAMQFIVGHSLDEILADVRRLRSNQVEGKAAPVEAGPDPNPTNHPALPQAVHDAAQTEAAADPLMQTVTHGLFTGQFAKGTSVVLDLEESPLPATEPIAPVMGLSPAMTYNIELEPGPARAPSLPSPTDGDRNYRDSASSPSSSSLAGHGEDRYHREVARLGAQVADALAYAHKRGVLHRDIKPSNLLLDAVGNVWITDFGLAKFEEGEDLSHSQDVVGTLRYMAPERFRGLSDRRCDIYSLGATLYELLTLRPAFESADRVRLIDQIVHEPTVPPRQLDRKIPRDLETIVLKALAKDSNHRFASAEEMAAELRRFVEYRPIRSRPIPYYQQFWRWCKRNPWLATANVTAATLTTVLAVVSTIAAFIYRDRNFQAVRDNVRIQRAQGETREQLFKALQAQARAGRFSRQMGQRFDGLAALTKAAAIARELKLPRERLDPLRDEAIACMALPDLKPTGRLINKSAGVVARAFDSTMTRYAQRFRDGTIEVRRVADDQEVDHFQVRGDHEIFVFGFSPDGRYLATAHHDVRVLTVRDIERHAVALHVPGDWSARFSPDSQRIAVQHAAKTLVYDLATSQVLRSWGGPAPGGAPVFRPDGAQIAVGYDDQNGHTCRILDADTGRLIRSFPLPRGGGASIAWSLDGATLAIVAHDDSKIYLWDAATGTQKATLEGSTNSGINTAFHPAGTLLASNGWESRLRLWDPVLGRPWLSLTGASASRDFSHDGRIVLEYEDKLTTYQVDPALEYRTLAHATSVPNQYGHPSIRHDGRILVVGSDRGVVLWDLARGAELGFLGIGYARVCLFEESGDLLTTGDLGALRWPFQLDQSRGVFQVGPPGRLALPPSHCDIAEDRSGTVVAQAYHGHAQIVTPGRAFTVGPLNDVRGLAVSPDGEWIATSSHSTGHVHLWHTSDGTEAFKLPIDFGGRVRFSSDGQWLLTGATPCRLWAVGTWREARQIGGEGYCFSADSRLLAVLDASKIIHLVESATGRTLARLESPDLCAAEVANFSPDGSRLVVTTPDGPAVHVWDLRAIRKHLTEMGLDFDAPPYSDEEAADRSRQPLPPLRVDYGPPRVTAPRDTELRRRAISMGTELAGRGQWEAAAAEFARAFADTPPNEPWLCFEYAIVLMAVADAQGYRSTCQYMLATLGKTKDLIWLQFTAHACVLASGPPAEANEALRLAERRQAILKTPWCDHVLGLALYRAGRFADAIAVLENSVKREPGRSETTVVNSLVLAMAHYKLGRPDEARRWLDRDQRWANTRMRDRPGWPNRAIPEGWNFREGILFHLLLREARELVEKGHGELPANVFAGER
jgi:eukaryotic-like serine/threonine-protein kinase